MNNINILFEGVKLSHEDIQKAISIRCDQLKELLLKKNEEYNDASFKTGIISNYARLHDKIDRYESLIKKLVNNTEIHFEGISDTILDISGYGVIGSIIVVFKLRYKKQPVVLYCL